MDGGGEPAAVERHGRRRREPDALDRWFARQRRAWRRKWRWVVWLIVALAAARLAYQITYVALVVWQFGPSGAVAGTRGLTPTWVVFFEIRKQVWPWLQYEEMFLLACALLMAFTLAATLTPPAELAIAFSPAHVYKRVLSAARRVFWSWLGLLAVALPVLCGMLDPVLVMPPSSILYFVSDALFRQVFFLAAVALFVTEWQLALLLRMPPGRSRLLLYLCPALVTVVALLLRSLPYGLRLWEYAPSFSGPVLPDAYDVWIAALHIGALAGGLLFGLRWWQRAIHFNTARGWYWLSALMATGLLLPALMWAGFGLWANRFIYAVSAFLHGAYLGNPFVGWTTGPFPSFDTYTDDLQLWASFFSNMWTLGRQDEAYALVASNSGFIFSPWVYLSVGWAWAWLFIYYGVSLLTVWLSNNRMPKGYRGTWEA